MVNAERIPTTPDFAAAWAVGSMISHSSAISPSSVHRMSTTAISGPASGSHCREYTMT
ncbi:hypothetical protein ACGFIR_15490 [Micromonospora sp. NPDC049051]|uniref:hypothetical protein n=1 Tax=Micromonospora sp. NPDC049051 TaxID=3364264 RepID=UPI003711EAB8